MTNHQHDLYRDRDKRNHFVCRLCGREWVQKPKDFQYCAEVPTYTWQNKPTELKTKTAWAQQGYALNEGAQYSAKVMSGDYQTMWELYAADQVHEKPKRKAKSSE